MSDKKTILIERTFDASVDDVWDLWTTKDGIEAWWGPDGFQVEVIEIDVRPGGQLHYAMTATAEPQVAFMKQHGMPLTTKTKLTYADVVRHRKLVMRNLVDFVQGVAAYETDSEVDFVAVPGGTKLIMTLQPMHDEVWTGRMAAGWESELGKLGKLIAARKQR